MQTARSQFQLNRASIQPCKDDNDRRSFLFPDVVTIWRGLAERRRERERRVARMQQCCQMQHQVEFYSLISTQEPPHEVGSETTWNLIDSATRHRQPLMSESLTLWVEAKRETRGESRLAISVARYGIKYNFITQVSCWLLCSLRSSQSHISQVALFTNPSEDSVACVDNAILMLSYLGWLRPWDRTAEREKSLFPLFVPKWEANEWYAFITSLQEWRRKRMRIIAAAETLGWSQTHCVSAWCDQRSPRLLPERAIADANHNCHI